MKVRFLGALVGALLSTAAVAAEAPVAQSGNFYLGAGTGQVWHEDANLGTSTPFYLQTGYDFGHLRLEAEYARLDGRTGANELNAHLVLGRAYLESTIGAVTPYVSGSVGYGWLDGGAVVDKHHADGLVVGLGAGIDYDLTKGWSTVAGYEYLTSTEKVRNASSVNEWQAHVLRVGIRKAI